MKKLFSLVFLFLCFYMNAQPPATMPELRACDSNNDGFATFDLASQIPAILNGLNPNTTTVTFHQSTADVQTGANPIAPINAYTNLVPHGEFLYIRVVDNSDVYFTTMGLFPVQAPSAGFDGSITVCETSTASIDLYSIITGEDMGGVWTSTSGTGGTFNPAAGTYTPAIGATTLTFFYTTSAASPCPYDTSVATINVIPQPNAGFNGNLTVCQGSTTAVNLYDIITNEQPGGIWTRDSGTGGTFNAATGTYTPAAGATASTFSYTIAGTAPCINDSSLAIISFTNCTSPPVCGGTFTDSGGAGSDYGNDTNNTTTICPTIPGEVVTVTFTSFNTEATYDVLYVYNGANTSAANMIPSTNPTGNIPGGLPGGYWGNSIPGPFTSSSQDGCLTFNFRSDGSNTSSGWVANVNCTPGCEAPTALTVTNLTTTSAVLSWNGGTVANSWEIYVVPQGSAIPGPPPGVGGTIVAGTNFIYTNSIPNQCYSFYVRSRCSLPSEWVGPLNFCMFDCVDTGQCPEGLALVAFLDANNNGTKDTGEDSFDYGNFVYQVNDSGANQYGSSNNGNYFIFDPNPANSYDISYTLNNNLIPYYSSSVSHNNVSIATGSGITYLYFPVVNTNPYVDAQVNLNPYSGQPRPGFTYYISLSYQNNGFEPISGTLNFTRHPSISIFSISEATATLTANGFTFDFSNLAPLSSHSITIGLTVPTMPTVNLGDLITNTATIQVANDVVSGNNSSTLTQTAVASYDPNDKCESHGGKIVHSTFTSNDYLTYTIQFENTGTANAEFIRIEDMLDTQLDESTFEMISASHAVNTKREGRQLTWHFYNIDLPPTVSNPAGSHGYINFRIKPKAGYAIGDIIPNTASIYFDYNPAIVTNTYNTEFVNALGTPNFNENTVSLYPNPASTSVSISNNNLTDRISKVVVYEITGKRIYSVNGNPLDTIVIDVSHFTKGIYLVEIWSDSNIKVTKKLILN